jgi:hypothetical protein
MIVCKLTFIKQNGLVAHHFSGTTNDLMVVTCIRATDLDRCWSMLEQNQDSTSINYELHYLPERRAQSYPVVSNH